MRPRFRTESGPNASREGSPLELVRVRRTQRNPGPEGRNLRRRSRRRGGRGRSGTPRPPVTQKPPGFWDWIKNLFRRPEQPAPDEQEARLMAGFCHHYHVHFRDLELLRLALTHRSYLSVTGRGDRESNERLEFLGDSVLGLVTSEFLFRTHPTEHEGQLTKTKSLLVSKAILARRALKMGLGRFVFMSHSEIESGGRQRLSILADAFESVIGAVYLDQGFEAARGFIHENLLSEAREIAADKRHTNYKSHLQEYVQSTYRTHPVYRIRREVGPDHSKQFVVDVMVGRRVLGTGRGQNKKDAEQASARDALDQVTTRREAPEVRGERSGGGRRARSEAQTVERPRAESPMESEPPSRVGRRGRHASRSEAPVDEAAIEVEIEEESVVPARRLPPVPTRIEAARMAAQAIPDDAPTEIESESEMAGSYDEVDDEIGRPEGPLEERHVDPFSFEEGDESGEPAERGPDLGRSVVSPLARMRSAPAESGLPGTRESSTTAEPGPTKDRYGRRRGRRR